MRKILVIQTAFIGDVVLATALLESLHNTYPDATLDILVRKGNETLFDKHPYLNSILVWNKKQHKYKHLFLILQQIRSNRYSLVLNLQRFAATGFLTAFSKADMTIGFNKNPFHFLFSKSVKHEIDASGISIHEVNRNHQLLQSIGQIPVGKPALYPSSQEEAHVAKWKGQPYICIAPTSVWFTKQFAENKWIDFLNEVPRNIKIFVLGGPDDVELCNRIIRASSNDQCTNLAGTCNFLQSAALMRGALMNYVNDSAPMHFCSAVNAPVTAIYCSTVPAFGFGPLSDQSFIVETLTPLSCRPCGLHGLKACPHNHFNCAQTIQISQLINTLPH